MAHLCFALTLSGFPIRLEQSGFDSFVVTYGEQRNTGLDYSAAADHLGRAILHALACESHLSNLSKPEARKDGEAWGEYRDSMLQPWGEPAPVTALPAALAVGLFTMAEAENALCVFDFLTTLHAGKIRFPGVQDYLDQNGIAAFRSECLAIGRAVESAWNLAEPEEFDSVAFDFEVLPPMLSGLEFSGRGVSIPEPAAMLAAARAELEPAPAPVEAPEAETAPEASSEFVNDLGNPWREGDNVKLTRNQYFERYESPRFAVETAPAAPIDPQAGLLFNCCTDCKEPVWSEFLELEIGGCVSEPDGSTDGGIAAPEAQFFTIYGRDRDGMAEAITDAPDARTALHVAGLLAVRSKLSVTVAPSLSGL